MSDFATEYTRVQTNILNAYNSISDKGGTIPTTKNSANLTSAINSIPLGFDSEFKAGDTAVDYTSFNVENLGGTFYDFSLDTEDGYYKSQNKGVKNSLAVCKLNFTTLKKNAVFYLDCIANVNYRNELYELPDSPTTGNPSSYGVNPQFQISPIDATIPDNTRDYGGYAPYASGLYGNSSVYIDFDYHQMPEVQSVPIIVSEPGEHYIVLVYGRMGTEADSIYAHDDNFQFKVAIDKKNQIPEIASRTAYYPHGKIYFDTNNYRMGTGNDVQYYPGSGSKIAQGISISDLIDNYDPISLYRGWDYTINQSESLWSSSQSSVPSKIIFLTSDVFTFIVSGLRINNVTEDTLGAYIYVGKVNSDNTITQLSLTLLENVPSNLHTYRIEKLSNTSIIIAFGGNTTSDPTTYGDYPFLKVISINTSTGAITQGISANIASTRLCDDNWDICILNNGTKVAFTGARSNTLESVVCSISTRSITVGTLQTLYDLTTIWGSGSYWAYNTYIKMTALDTDKIFLLLINASTGVYYGVVCSVSSRYITLGTGMVLLDGTTVMSDYWKNTALYKQNISMVYLINNNWALPISIIDTTISINTNLISIKGESGCTIRTYSGSQSLFPLSDPDYYQFIETDYGTLYCGTDNLVLYTINNKNIIMHHFQQSYYEHNHGSRSSGARSSVINSENAQIITIAWGNKYKDSTTGNYPLLMYVTKPYTDLDVSKVLTPEWSYKNLSNMGRLPMPSVGFALINRDSNYIRKGGKVTYIFDTDSPYTPIK